jgi:predicted transcriptional regulator of viral defense system
MKKANISQKRFLDLARLKQNLFHVDDLARIWGITDRNNLRVTLYRYVKQGLLFRIYRGLYSLVEASKLDPLFLGAKAINNYCYLSAESVLSSHGVIFQEVSYITYISSINRRFKIGSFSYYSRQLSDKFLHNTTGIEQKNNISVASLERAVADILHFNSSYHFDNSKKIDWQKVREIQVTLGYKII